MSKLDKKGLHRRLTLNSISNVARHVLTMGIALFLTPYIVRTLGDSLYGFWVLLMSFVGYAGILEMGVQPAVVKLVGQYRGTREQEKLHEMVTTAFLFFMGVASLAAILVLTVAPIIVQGHVEGLAEIQFAQILFFLIAADAIIMYMTYFFTGILYGFQRYHLWNLIDASTWVLNAALVLLFLERGGIIALMSAKLTKDVVGVTATALSVRRIFPGLRINPRLVTRESFKQLLGFGGRVFLSATTTRIATHAQPLIISTSLSAAATGFYAIPVKLLNYTRAIAWTLTASFMPMFSELDSRNERSVLRSIYLNYSRYIFMILLPILVLVIVYGRSFIGLWIGPEYAERGHVPLLLLSAAVIVESAQPLLWRFFVGVGHLNILVKISAAGSILVVVLGIVMVHPFGISGVALSVLIGAVFAQSIYAVQASRYLEISLISMVSRVHLRPVAVAVVTFAFATLLEQSLGAGNYPLILAGASISTTVYLLLALRWGLTPDERSVVLARVRSKIGRGAQADEIAP